MRLGEAGWLVWLASLPFAHLFFRPADPWHAHAAWAQAGILLLLAVALAAPTHSLPPNPPLAWIVGWVFLHVWWMMLQAIRLQQQYFLWLLPGVTHLAIILLGYLAFQLRPPKIELLLDVVGWSGLVMLAYCGLQALNLDPIFRNLDTSQTTDPVVGTIGNPEHLAAYFALLIPVYLTRSSRWLQGLGWLLVPWVTWLSAGGGLAASGAVLWMAWRRSWRIRWVLPVMGLIGFGILYHLQPDVLNPHGRWLAWQTFAQLPGKAWLWGLGPGTVLLHSQGVLQGSPIFQWRHCHNEWLQFSLENGLLGVGLLGWLVIDTGRRLQRSQPTPTTLACGGLLLACALNSSLNFTAHLWMLGSLALVAYSEVVRAT